MEIKKPKSNTKNVLSVFIFVFFSFIFFPIPLFLGYCVRFLLPCVEVRPNLEKNIFSLSHENSDNFDSTITTI